MIQVSRCTCPLSLPISLPPSRAIPKGGDIVHKDITRALDAVVAVMGSSCLWVTILCCAMQAVWLKFGSVYGNYQDSFVDITFSVPG